MMGEQPRDIFNVYHLFIANFLLYLGPVLVLANAFVIFILTRKPLRTPYNMIFILMALDQSIAILCRDILIWQSYETVGCGVTASFAWRLFELAISNLSTIFGAHVSWLAVIITFVRLRNLRSNAWEPTYRFMIVASSTAFAVVIAASIPLFISLDVKYVETSSNCGEEGSVVRSVPIIAESDRMFANDCLLLRVVYFTVGVVFSALPCLLLVCLSFTLAFRMRKIHKNHVCLAGCDSAAASADSARTSWMITMIVLTTLLTDVPQATVNILVGFLSDRFRVAVAQKLGPFIVTFLMISSACNLAIHLCMSRRFREVTKTYMCCVCSKMKTRK